MIYIINLKIYHMINKIYGIFHVLKVYMRYGYLKNLPTYVMYILINIDSKSCLIWIVCTAHEAIVTCAPLLHFTQK